MKNKLVFGVGINDADYVTNPKIKVNGKWKSLIPCPYYVKWHSMLERGYSKRFQEKNPTYKDCSICEDWLLFSTFKIWMEQQEWKKRQLDKDFLFENNKMYSEDTCVFVPHKVNNFITTSGKSRGDHPLGVSLKKGRKKNPYQSYCADGVGKLVYLGYFPTPQKAHQVWLVKKLEICEAYLLEFKNEPLIIKGLTRIKDKLEYHIETKTELMSF